MKCDGTASVSAAAGARQSIWWISVARNRAKVELPACDLLQSFTTQVKCISQFLPAIAVARFSLNLIFVPFPRAPVFLYFSRVKPLRFLILTCCRSNQKVEPLRWKGFSHGTEIQCLGNINASFFIKNFTSMFSSESIYLSCVGRTQYLTCTITSWTVTGFVIDEWNSSHDEADRKLSYDENRKIIKNTKCDLYFQCAALVAPCSKKSCLFKGRWRVMRSRLKRCVLMRYLGAVIQSFFVCGGSFLCCSSVSLLGFTTRYWK